MPRNDFFELEITRTQFSGLITFYVVVFTLFSTIVCAQNIPPHKFLNLRNGLPSNEVYCMAQDTTGAMWLGTDVGLVKYMGSEIKTIVPKSGNKISVLRIYVDPKNRVWISTFRDGMFYVDGDSLVEPVFNDNLLKLINETNTRYVRSFSVNESGKVVFALNHGGQGFFSATLKAKTIFHHQIDLKKNGYSFYCTKIENQPSVYLLINHSLQHEINVAKHTVEEGAMEINEITINPETGSTSYGIDNTQQYVWTNNIIYNLNNGTKSVVLSSSVNDIYIEKENCFVSTSNGIYHFKKSIVSDNFIEQYYQNDNVSRVRRDNEGIYWVSTVGNGCLIMPSIPLKKTHIPEGIKFSSPTKSCTLANDTIGLINDRTMLFGSIVDSFSVIGSLLLPKEFKDRNLKTKWRSPTDLLVGVMPGNRLHLGTVKQKEYKKTQFFKEQFSGAFKNIYLNAIEAIQNSDSIYVLTTQGAWLVVHDNVTALTSDLIDKDIKCMAFVDGNNLLFGTTKGLYGYEIKSGKAVKLFKHEIDDWISCLEKDQNGEIYIGTVNNGLYRLADNKLRLVSSYSELGNQAIQQIKVVNRVIWVKTQKDLFGYKIESTNRLVGFKMPLALYGLDFANQLLFNRQQPVVLQNNELIILDTAVLYYPFSNKIRLVSTTVNHKSIDIQSFTALRLKYDDNNLGFVFKKQTLHETEENRIAYRLLGQNENWKYTKDGYIQFSDLPAGTYSLEAMAENCVGTWSVPKEYVTFTIHPHFTQTFWFKLVIFGSVLATVAIAFFVGRGLSRKENQLLQANITALKRQINPHFILNSLNTLRYLQSTNQLEKADSFIVRLSALLNQVVYSTDRKRVMLNDEIKRIKSYAELEAMRFENHFDFDIEGEEKLDTKKLFIPPMLLQPLVENAIKHGISRQSKGRIILKLWDDDDFLYISLQDNGPGASNEALFKNNNSYSIGLQNVVERLQLISKLEKKHLSLTSSSENGLMLTLKIEK